MPGTMWCTVNSNLFHKRSPIAVNYIKILFFQMHIFFLQIKKFGDTCAIIKQHEDNLIVFVLLHCPDFCDVFFREFCTCMLVWIAVFVLGDFNKSRIIFVAGVNNLL